MFDDYIFVGVIVGAACLYIIYRLLISIKQISNNPEHGCTSRGCTEDGIPKHIKDALNVATKPESKQGAD